MSSIFSSLDCSSCPNSIDTITEILKKNHNAVAPLAEMEDDNEENKDIAKNPSRLKLENWLNKSMKIEMSDKRILIGLFLCTDRDSNIILGSCNEYLNWNDEPRLLGLAMIPGHHIRSISITESIDVL